MAKKSAIEKNIRRIKTVSLKKTRRENLKSIIRDKSKSIEDLENQLLLKNILQNPSHLLF